MLAVAWVITATTQSVPAGTGVWLSLHGRDFSALWQAGDTGDAGDEDDQSAPRTEHKACGGQGGSLPPSSSAWIHPGLLPRSSTLSHDL